MRFHQQSEPSWSEKELVEQTNAAFKSYHSLLTLARSPLADSSLIRPLLILDDVSPTATERGQALRLVLRWAVNQLAPAQPPYRMGARRPLDDSSWQDPLWWQYNILRHRYIEPLHPDEFVEGGRITETLIARMGIPGQDVYFEERNRAVREAARWLHRQLSVGQASHELLSPALEEVLRPIGNEVNIRTLLEIAAIFGFELRERKARHNVGHSDEVFPRALLVDLAQRENLNDIDTGLSWLIEHRYLQAGDDDRHLWMSPVLRGHLYARQETASRTARHRRAARYFEKRGDFLRAVRHLLHAGQADTAALRLLHLPPESTMHATQIATLTIERNNNDTGEAETEGMDIDGEEMIRLLATFSPRDVSLAHWRELQIRLADLLGARGEREGALAACRRALRTAPPEAGNSPVATAGAPDLEDADNENADNRARIYRRMGKLYEKHNQLHALGYYDQAAELFSPNHPEYVTLLKDRGWLHILRQSWPVAESDLHQALRLAPRSRPRLRADIDDALASLYRHQKRFDDAIDYARRALNERETLGDPLRVAHSFNNLGLIYNELADYHHAIAAFEEALAIFKKLQNRELIAGARLNIGLAHHLAGRLHAAIEAYEKSLALCRLIDLPLVQTRAHANLAEALLALNRNAEAQEHWQAGLVLSMHAGFDEEIAYYRSLQEQFPILRATTEKTQLRLRQMQTMEPSAPEALPVHVDAGKTTTQSPVSKEEFTLQESDPATEGVAAVEVDRHRPIAMDPILGAILELAHSKSQITPRMVMKLLAVSKATATRRLAELVEQGCLARYGKGRAVAYTIAGPETSLQPTTSPDLAEISRETLPVDIEKWHSILAGESATLVREFGVPALGFSARAPECWSVRFVRLPDLPTFFRLESYLARLLGKTIHLKPHAHNPDSDAVFDSDIIWVWTWHDGDG